MKIQSKFFPTLTSLESGMIACTSYKNGMSTLIFLDILGTMYYFKYGACEWNPIKDSSEFDTLMKEQDIQVIGYPHKNILTVDYGNTYWKRQEVQQIVIEVKGLVGKTMTVMDNSFSRDLTHDTDHANLYGKDVVIVAEPKKVQVHSDWESPLYEVMVEVVSPESGYRYEVLFNESTLR